MNPTPPKPHPDAFPRALARVQAQAPRQVHAWLYTDDRDDCLILLHHRLNEVGESAISVHLARAATSQRQVLTNLEFALANLAAFAVTWLIHDLPGAYPVKPPDLIYDAIRTERIRQQTLLLAGKISFACNSPIVDPRRKFRVLAEEVGEVAAALDQLECARRADVAFAHAHLGDELIQVAAVAIAWLESLQPISGGRLQTKTKTKSHSTCNPAPPVAAPPAVGNFESQNHESQTHRPAP